MRDEEVGALVQRWRKERRLGVRELAKTIQVHHTLLSRLESGQRRLSVELAERLDRELTTAGDLAAAVAEVRTGQAHGTSNGNGRAVVPAQLPPVEDLVDRVRLVETITGEGSRPAPVNSSSPRTVVLTGPGGVGKTAIAIAAAARMRHEFDGVLWADLRGWDLNTGPRAPAVVLRSWCAATTGTPVTALPADLDDLVALWRSVLQEKRYIIGVDNARSEQIGALIPASPGSVVLITSRDRVPDVPGRVVWLSVPPLEPDDATALIAARARKPAREVAGLACRGGGLPLALRSLGDYIAAHDADEEMIAEMSADTAPPDAVRRNARLSYEHLTEEQARAWRLCAILPEITPESAAAATDTDLRQVRELLNGVADVSLLSKHGRNWTYHELHRAIALEESRRVDPRAVRDGATERSLLYMLHGWANAAVTLAPDRAIGPPLDTPPPSVAPPTFDSYEAALDWSETRWEYLPAAVRAAIDKGWNRLAWQLAACSFNYVILVKAYEQAMNLTQTVLEVTERSDVMEGQAWMLHIQGCIETERGDLDGAVRVLTRALEIRRRRGDLRDIGWTAQAFVRARLFRGDPPNEVLVTATEAVDSLDALGATSGAASARSVRGNLYLVTGDLPAAAADLTRAVEQLPIGGDPLLHCYAYTRLAETQLKQHELDEAEQLARHAVEYAEEHSARFSEVDALDILGRVLNERHDAEGAASAWTRALQIADNIGAVEADQIQERLECLNDHQR
ncbi:NB-ARC domain-containing protein [Saccharopolyspora gregorii]|uniref:NB-ARC domain-containing protein n=1 Tax=Saccharopolyspora gregorii TaxID=33914 RepID=UPI0021AC031F|nr:NB-ARC domain-containing protein [Saccharopolyspora gregorii]